MFVLLFKSLVGAYLEGPWNRPTGAQVERYWLFNGGGKNQNKNEQELCPVLFFLLFSAASSPSRSRLVETRGGQEFQELAVV